MKIGKALLFSLLLLALIVSCTQESSTTVTINAESQMEQWFSAGRNTHINISNMDPTVLYAVKTKNSGSRSVKATAKDTETNQGIVTTETGTHIPIPDSNNSCNFVGGDVEITSKDEIQVIQLTKGSDCRLSVDSEPTYIDEDGHYIWEEYYYVDFSQEPYNFSSDELTRLTFVNQGRGNIGESADYAVVSTDFAELVDWETKMFGTFDLSKHEGVILYNKLVGDENSYGWNQLILRPTTMVSCNSEEVALTNYYEILQIDASTADPNKEYVLVINVDDNVDGYYHLMETAGEMMCYLDGSFKGFATPIISDEEASRVFHLGKITPEKDFILHSQVYNNQLDVEYDHYADVYIREINDYEKNMISIMLSDQEDTIYTLDIPANTRLELSVMVDAEPKVQKDNLYVTFEARYINDDDSLGDFIAEMPTESYLNMKNNNPGGHAAGKSMTGSCITRTVSNKMDLESIYLLVNCLECTQPIRVTITIKRSEEALPFVEQEGGNQLTIVNNNGDPPTTVFVEYDTYYTAPPAPSRAGYSFKGWWLLNTLYNPGDSMRVDGYSTLVGVWDEE